MRKGAASDHAYCIRLDKKYILLKDIIPNFRRIQLLYLVTSNPKAEFGKYRKRHAKLRLSHPISDILWMVQINR